MKTTVSITLDTRRAKRDGTYPLIIRLGHRRKTTSISLGLSLDLKHWDSRNRKIKSTYKGASSVAYMNNMLSKKLTSANDILYNLSQRGELDFLSITEVKSRLVEQTDYESFYEFTEKLIREYKQVERFGNARSHHSTLSAVKKFVQKQDLKFNEINRDFLKRFEINHLSKKGNGYNGLAMYLKTIRAIYNKAIKAHIVPRESYPFYDYKIKVVPTEKRAIDRKELKKIMNLSLEEGHRLFHARNYFLLSYMLYGISFTDLAFLRRSNIIGERIVYRRRKTGKMYDIHITKQIKALLDIYLEKESQVENFIFPIIKRATLEDHYKDINSARLLYNQELKQIGKLCEIAQNLTSYVSRHSFATQALLLDIPLVAISQMLGHSKLNTTQIYLKSLPNHILDDYQKKIIEL